MAEGQMMPDGERVLAVHPSPFETLVITEDAAGRRTLRFGHEGVRQSVGWPGEPLRLELDYARTLPAALSFLTGTLRRLAVIGLGGGTLPRYFRARFPEVEITVVERDPGVREVARRWFGLVEEARLQVAVEDGRDWLESPGPKLEVLILDCFGAEEIPAHLTTLEFLESACRRLTPGGVVVANIWGPETNPLYGRMLATYGAAFGSVQVLAVPRPRTKLFVARAEAGEPSRAELLERAGALFGRFGVSEEMRAALAGAHPARPGKGKVLRDGGE